MEQVKKFALDIGWIFISSIVTLLFGLLLRIVLARWLGAADLGLYQMVITIQGMAALIATFGIPAALIKYVAEYKDDKEKLSQTISSGLISLVIFGIVAGILLYALSEMLASIFQMPELASLLKILALAFPLNSLLQALLGIFNGLRKMKYLAFVAVLQSFLLVLFTIAFVKLGFGVAGAVFGIILSVIGGGILGLYLLRDLLRLNLQGLVQNAKKLALFGSQMFGAGALGLICTQADIVLIGYFLTAKDVGYYSVAVVLSSFFTLVPVAFQKVTYPATSEYWSKNNHQALQKVIDKSMKYCACIVLPIGLGVGFFAEEIVTVIFGREFIYAALPLCVLLIARVITSGTSSPIGQFFSGIGRPDLHLKIDAITAGANIALNIVLIPRFGILGAAIATAASMVFGTIIFLVLMPKLSAIKIDVRWYAKVMGSAFIVVALFLVGSKFINTYVVGGVVLCAYLVLVFKLFLTKEDLSTFRSLTYSLVFRR